jgi:hypothetical protein
MSAWCSVLINLELTTIHDSKTLPICSSVNTIYSDTLVEIQNVFIRFLFVVIKDFPVDLRLETLMIINNYAELSGFIGSCLICV